MHTLTHFRWCRCRPQVFNKSLVLKFPWAMEVRVITLMTLITLVSTSLILPFPWAVEVWHTWTHRQTDRQTDKVTHAD